MTKQDFFKENDLRACKKLLKILLYTICAFPAIFILNLLGIFHIDYTQLIILFIISLVLITIPHIMNKCSVSLNMLKYSSVICLGSVIMLLGTNSRIGIYITYTLIIFASCMFYDRRFTIHMCIVGTIQILISLFFRSLTVDQITAKSPMSWFISMSMGFIIEAVVVSLFAISISTESRKMLEKLHNTTQLETIINTCEESSINLASMMSVLHDDISKSAKTNETITNSTKTTISDLHSSIEHVENTKVSIDRMTHASDIIASMTTELTDISTNTTSQMDEYKKSIEATISYMHDIKTSSDTTELSITNLSDAINEIAILASDIMDITSQTNLLALNASIEAARAGEQGKGFSVVADSVRELADRSKESSSAITNLISKIETLLNDVRVSNHDNLNFVNKGIAKITTIIQDTQIIYDLQSDIKNLIDDISEHCASTKENSKQVNSMIYQLNEIVTQSMTRAQDIVNETTTQLEVFSSLEHSFRNVNNISDELLEISNIKVDN